MYNSCVRQDLTHPGRTDACLLCVVDKTHVKEPIIPSTGRPCVQACLLAGEDSTIQVFAAWRNDRYRVIRSNHNNLIQNRDLRKSFVADPCFQESAARILFENRRRTLFFSVEKNGLDFPIRRILRRIRKQGDPFALPVRSGSRILRDRPFESILLGGEERTRTVNPRLAKPVLCQLSYFPSITKQSIYVGLSRLELLTPRLSSVCSNQLSYRPEKHEQSL